MKLLSALILSLGLSVSVWADDEGPDAYLCIEEHVGGVKWLNAADGWEGTKLYDPEGKQKYILRRRSNEERIHYSRPTDRWVFMEHGTARSWASCPGDIEMDGNLRCDGSHGNFWFNKSSLRYQLFYDHGFVDSTPSEDSSGNTPNVEIGTCTPL